MIMSLGKSQQSREYQEVCVLVHYRGGVEWVVRCVLGIRLWLVVMLAWKCMNYVSESCRSLLLRQSSFPRLHKHCATTIVVCVPPNNNLTVVGGRGTTYVVRVTYSRGNRHGSEYTVHRSTTAWRRLSKPSRNVRGLVSWLGREELGGVDLRWTGLRNFIFSKFISAIVRTVTFVGCNRNYNI